MSRTFPHAAELPASLRGLIDAIEAMKGLTPRSTRELLLAHPVPEHDLAPWVDLGHPAADSYGRRMVHHGRGYELMVMSWAPGDFSAIHDHGYTEWGAVRVYGELEHATFLVQDGQIRTLARSRLRGGQVLSVGHQLVHQMGNPGRAPAITLHLYGTEAAGGADVTADARVFDLDEGELLRASGGMFLALPPGQVRSQATGPEPDFLTWLRHGVEKMRRVQRVRARGEDRSGRFAEIEQRLRERLFDVDRYGQFEADLLAHLDLASGQMEDLGYWRLLRQELLAAAELQRELLEEAFEGDLFHSYAELYDAVVGRPCLDEFIAPYLRFVAERYHLDYHRSRICSVGCGTGLVEAHLIEELGVPRESLLGLDLSPAMVQVASRRIRARVADAMQTGEPDAAWDITYCGLNVFQYLPPERLSRAIAEAARITRPGGCFIGDFITPDHIRLYAHVARSVDGTLTSLRQPRLVERDHQTFQESEIIHVNRGGGRLHITSEGRHLRYLPAVARLLDRFRQAFDGRVDAFDAVTLRPLDRAADTCPSTRYVVVARRS